MTKTQTTILVLLVVLVLGVFGTLTYLLLGRPATPAAPTPAITGVATQNDSSATAEILPTPTPTATPWPGIVSSSESDAQTAATATLAAVVAATADAQQRIEAALRQLPAEELEISAEEAGLSLTVLRMGWNGPGALWLRLKVNNSGSTPLAFDPSQLVVADEQGAPYAPSDMPLAGSASDVAGEATQPTANALPGALAAGTLDPGGRLEGIVAFKLVPLHVPALLTYNDGAHTALKIDLLSAILGQPSASATP